MMKEQGMKLKEELMNLPQSDRASLAEELLRSLDTELEENYEQEWLEEIRKRSEELKEGEVEPVEFEEVIQEALSVLK
jgi:isopropylmalate/homocitrate/citramalate synthase